ncbi:MAG: hypothetical protein EP306_02890, partial [Burkholderiales bacterium]
MDAFIGLMLLVLGGYTLKTFDERQRIELLGRKLSPYRLEPLMAELLDGYLRALAENDADRSATLWQDLAATEARLNEQMQTFAADLSDVWGEKVRVSRLPFSLPMATRL